MKKIIKAVAGKIIHVNDQLGNTPVGNIARVCGLAWLIIMAAACQEIATAILHLIF